jgi:hypothetical protein
VKEIESPIDFRKAWALVLRDIYNWTSYKSQVVTGIGTAVIGIASWGFLGTFNSASVPEYNTNYVSFLLSGVLLSTVLLPASGVSTRFSPWTLESIIMTGINTPTYVLGSLGWGYTLSLIFFIPQLFLCLFLFPFHFGVNFVSLLVAVPISAVMMLALGIISSGLRLVTKVTDPFTWFLGIAQNLLAGMTFPIQHLNSVYPNLSDASWLLPQTWVYHIMRLSILGSGSLTSASVALAFGEASAYALVLLFLSIRVFRWGLKRAKQEGTLGWY